VIRVSRFMILAVVIILGGCAAREDAIILDNRTSSLESQVYRLRESNEEMKSYMTRGMSQAEKKMDVALQPVHQAQANTTAQIEALKTQIQDLQGRIEAFEYRQKNEQNRLSETLVHDLKELQVRLQRLEKPPPPPPPPPSPAGPPASPSPEPGIKPDKGKETIPVSKDDPKEAKEPAKEKPKPKATPEAVYEEAGALFKKQSFEEAQKKYEEYLKIAPKGKYVEEARFGLAESLFRGKDFEEAILTYQKLIKSFPKSSFIPEALYKQALSFLSLKDNGSARLLLEKIIKDFPKSGQAKQAKKKLKSF
jgi:tol-pal system protein YbgF